MLKISKPKNDIVALAQQSTLQSKKAISRKEEFGAVSSDSEPELIRDNWDLSDEELNCNENGFSSDIDTSESDNDEPSLSHDLSSSNEGSISDENSSEFEENGPPVNISDLSVGNVPDSSQRIEKTETEKFADGCKNVDLGSPSNLNKEESLLSEIERRAISLAARSLYIAPIPSDCNLEKLRRLSSASQSARLSFNPHSKLCRKYAFLEFASDEAASAARKSLMGRIFAGKSLVVQPVRPHYSRHMGWSCLNLRQLYISGLHSSVTKADLSTIFPKATEIEYPQHLLGYHLGFALVSFANNDVTCEAFYSVHNQILKGQTVAVNFAILPRNACNEIKQSKIKPEGSKSTSDTSATLAAKHLSSHLSNNFSDHKPKVLVQSLAVDMPVDEREEEENNTSKSINTLNNTLSTLLRTNKRKRSVSASEDDSADSEESDFEENDVELGDSSSDSASTSDSSSATIPDDDEGSDGSAVEDVANECFGNRSTVSANSMPTNNEIAAIRDSDMNAELSSGEDIDQLLSSIMSTRRAAATALKSTKSRKYKRFKSR